MRARRETADVRAAGLPSNSRRARGTRPILLGAVALAAIVADGVGYAPENFGFGGDDSPVMISIDLDGDGLPNSAEVDGWPAGDGETYRSDPVNPDTDGDGLIDAAEADFGLDPVNADSDGDDISDGRETYVVGTSPLVADTDGDGFDDGYEDSHQEDKDLSPIWVDVKVSKGSFITDFAIGAVFGDSWRKDSNAWLAGYLASSGSSSVPVIGWVVGPLADVRDAIASAVTGDWVSSGFSALGAVPYAGDAVSIPAKAAGFVARNPELAAIVAASVVSISRVPEEVKVTAVKQIFKKWNAIKEQGAGEETLLRLTAGRVDIDALASIFDRKGHVDGANGEFFEDVPAAAAWLESVESDDPQEPQRSVTLPIAGCDDGCNESGFRAIDLKVDGIAHEVRVGHTVLDDTTERQVRSDAHLISQAEIDGAHWHFMASANSDTIGADPKLLDLLDEVGIGYTIHIPS